MGKVKSKSIVEKRFKLTKNGKVLHRTQGARHLRSRKNKSRQRRQDEVKHVDNTPYRNKIKVFLTT